MKTKLILLTLLLIILVTTPLIAMGCGDNLETTTYTGSIVAFIPACERGISLASNWYFVCFADGTEFYVFGKPEIVLGEEVSVTFAPRPKLFGGFTITKVTGGQNQ